MPIDQINIRTQEIDEILGKTPNRIIRWGVSLIFLIVLILLIGSWFFRYPDFIKSTIEITTSNPPADIISRANGKIDTIYVLNSEKVKNNQIIAIIENPTKYSDFAQLAKNLESFEENLDNPDSSSFSAILGNKSLELGELQSDFSLFVSACKSFLNYQNLGFFDKKVESVKRQISDYRLFYKKTYEQKQTMKEDLELARKDYERFKYLFNNLAIPEADLEKSHSRFLNKKYSFESISTSLANINIQISRLESSIIDLQLQQQQQREDFLVNLNGAFENLKAHLDIWEQKYVLKAPLKGICVFTKYWSKNQNITLGEKIMTIVPNESGNIVGKLLLPIVGAGKVKSGQRVNIRLHNYPYMEFGMLTGVVQSISSIANEDFYYVEVGFPHGMKTSYGIQITFSQKMQGTAEIITEDIRLLNRITRPIVSILNDKIY